MQYIRLTRSDEFTKKLTQRVEEYFMKYSSTRWVSFLVNSSLRVNRMYCIVSFEQLVYELFVGKDT